MRPKQTLRLQLAGVNPWSETNFIVHTLNKRSRISQRAVPKSRHAAVSRTVQECNVFMLLGLALSEKQIPRLVGNVSS